MNWRCVAVYSVVVAGLCLAGPAVGQSDPIPVLETYAVNANAFDGTGTDAREPAIATDGAGTWVAAFIQTTATGRQMVTRTSTDNGATWGAEVVVFDGAGGDGTPDIAYAGGTWVLTWVTRSNPLGIADKGENRDVAVVRSTDNGATWSALQLMDTAYLYNGGQREEWPVVAGAPGGQWLIVWRSNEPVDLGDGDLGDDRDQLYSYSLDDGQTWSSVQALNPHAADPAMTGSDSKASIVWADGAWVVVGQSTNELEAGAGTDSDLWCYRSTDLATGWSGPYPVNTTYLTDNDPIIHESNPNLAYNANDDIVMASWNTEGAGEPVRMVWTAMSMDKGLNWTDPVLVSTEDLGVGGHRGDAWVAYWDGGGAETFGLGHGGAWLVAYTSEADVHGAGGDRDIMVTASVDGVNWTAPALVNDWATESIDVQDRDPRIAVGQDGAAVVVWFNNTRVEVKPGSGAERDAWMAVVPYGWDDDNDGVINGLEGVNDYLNPNSDYNGDGIPNVWLFENGYDPTTPGLGATVLDSETGFTLFDAYQTGSDPNDPSTWPAEWPPEEPAGMPVSGGIALLALMGSLGAYGARRLRA